MARHKDDGVVTRAAAGSRPSVMANSGDSKKRSRPRPGGDKKVRAALGRAEEKFKRAKARARAADEILLTEEAGYLEAEGMEATFKFKQKELKGAVDINAAASMFQLSLPSGPYSIDYTRNGRHMVFGGTRGHLAQLDCLRLDVTFEVDVGDVIHDVKALHNENMVAVAQRKYVYIYDSTGAEVHCMRSHLEPRRLQFLHHHFLLASIGRTGWLKYQDTSTGTLVSQHRTKLGSCAVLSQNPATAVLHAGHANGVVTLWSPVVAKPLVSMFTHRGPITALAVDPSGRHMVTCGQDGQTRIWDLRTYRQMHAYLTKHPPTTASISQRGLLALGSGCHVSVWRDALARKAKMPYMEHSLEGSAVRNLVFRPFEDVLGVGHDSGYQSLLIPGAGEPNYDTFEANPFAEKKQRREAEVRSLLDKLQPETISLDPSLIGTVDREAGELLAEQRALAEAADRRRKPDTKPKEKNKTRGRSKIAKKLAKKQKNVVDAGVMKLRQKLEEERQKRKEAQGAAAVLQEPSAALRRFVKKPATSTTTTSSSRQVARK
jgi:U3 small nucleolar RNA-associated protein 7